MNQKQRERARIAFGLDPRPRNQALKAWNTKWAGTTATSTGGWYKAVGGVARLATKAHSAPQSQIPVFSAEYATDHSLATARGLSSVMLRSDGETIYAGAAAVKSVNAAGVDRYGFKLVELLTDTNQRYIVARKALHLKD